MAAHQAPHTRAGGQAHATVIVVMGVAGAGKTMVGRALAESSGRVFLDADDFHSPANVQKMAEGIALTDDDRAPWLAALQATLERHLATGTQTVLACSALRQSYRDALLPAGRSQQQVAFVQLDVSPTLAQRRIASRAGHYMHASLVASQFATLEETQGALRLDGSLPVADLVARIRATLDG